MDRTAAEKIMELQERFFDNPENRELIAEMNCSNARFLQALETMTPQQREAVLDYCGAGIEVYLKLLELAVREA